MCHCNHYSCIYSSGIEEIPSKCDTNVRDGVQNPQSQTGVAFGQDNFRASMNRTNDYSHQTLLQCTYGHASLTWVVNLFFFFHKQVVPASCGWALIQDHVSESMLSKQTHWMVRNLFNNSRKNKVKQVSPDFTWFVLMEETSLNQDKLCFCWQHFYLVHIFYEAIWGWHVSTLPDIHAGPDAQFTRSGSDLTVSLWWR